VKPRPAPDARTAHLVRIGDDAGRAALLVDGVVQSISAVDGLERGGYWAAMVPATVRPRRVLILGLGGGTLAHMLVHRWGPELEIVGVDDDISILETARAAGWLELPGLRLVQGDAFAFVQACEERFDYIAVDLYRANQFVGRVLTKPVLRRLRALLGAHGRVGFNLFLDRYTAARLARIEQVLKVVERRPVGMNVVVFAQP
jgi:spermidine synthase